MKKKLTILFLGFQLFFFFFSLPAQKNQIDSLENLMKNSKEDTNKIKILNELAQRLVQSGNYGQAIQYSNQALIIAHQHLKQSENSINDADSLWYKKSMGRAYNTLGIIQWYKGDYDKALELYFQALKINEEVGNKSREANILNNIGLLYQEKKDYDKALEIYVKSLTILKEIGDKNGIAASYNNIGIVYKNKNDYTHAIENYLLSISVKKEIGDRAGIGFSYNNIGIIYFNEGNYFKAAEYYDKALKIFEEIGDNNGITASFNNMGGVYLKQNRLSEAKNQFSRSLVIAKEIAARPNIMDAYLGLSQCDSALNDFEGAYENHKFYTAMKDSIYNEESSMQIAEMQTKYETEKKELQIENLNKDNAIKETEIKKQNIQKLAFASGFGLMLALAFVIFRGYKQKQKANEIISAQKREVEKQKEIVDEKNKSLEIAYKHIEEKNHEILDSIRYAKRIQEAILPPQKLVRQYLEQSFILYKPKDIVAGDFYWMEPKENKVLFASVDCTGHGVPGAFVSILGYNGLNRCVKEFGLTQPAAILDKLCELVDEAFSKSETDIKDGMDIALCALELPSHNGEGSGVRLQYAGAGNSLYHIRNGVLIEYPADKQPIGKFAYRKSFSNYIIQLQKNDTIYVFTDGYADQFGGPKGKKFKYSQFEKLLLSFQEKSMSEQWEILNDTIHKWRGELEQIDDICIIGLRL